MNGRAISLGVLGAVAGGIFVFATLWVVFGHPYRLELVTGMARVREPSRNEAHDVPLPSEVIEPSLERGRDGALYVVGPNASYRFDSDRWTSARPEKLVEPPSLPGFQLVRLVPGTMLAVGRMAGGAKATKAFHDGAWSDGPTLPITGTSMIGVELEDGSLAVASVPPQGACELYVAKKGAATFTRASELAGLSYLIRGGRAGGSKVVFVENISAKYQARVVDIATGTTTVTPLPKDESEVSQLWDTTIDGSFLTVTRTFAKRWERASELRYAIAVVAFILAGGGALLVGRRTKGRARTVFLASALAGSAATFCGLVLWLMTHFAG